MKRCSVVLVWLSWASSAGAQSFALEWRTQDGGGGTSTGGTYVLSDTIGQPDAGASIGGSYALSSGFWSVMSTATQPTPPPFRTPTPSPTPTPIPGTLVHAPGDWPTLAQMMLAALFCGAWLVHRASKRIDRRPGGALGSEGAGFDSLGTS